MRTIALPTLPQLPLRRTSLLRHIQHRLSSSSSPSTSPSSSRSPSRLSISPPTNPRHVSGHSSFNMTPGSPTSSFNSSTSSSQPIDIVTPPRSLRPSSSAGHQQRMQGLDDALLLSPASMFASSAHSDVEDFAGGLAPMPAVPRYGALTLMKKRAGTKRRASEMEEVVLEPRPLEWCQGIGEVLGEGGPWF